MITYGEKRRVFFLHEYSIIYLFSFLVFSLLDETIIDPVYETLKIAAETRKRTLANYLQQRQQTLNKQTSLNSQGSSEPDIQPSPRTSRHPSRTDTEYASSLRPPVPSTHLQAGSPSGKRHSTGHFANVVETCQLNIRHQSLDQSSIESLSKEDRY